MADTTAERTLVLLRHAKATHDPMPDRDRMLTSRGHADATAVGVWLVEAGHAFDLVICSPSVRTRETWDDVARAGLTPADVRFDARVYDASADDLLDVLADVPAEVGSVLVVGHAPGIPDLAEALADPERSDAESLHTLRRTFPTSCFAALGLDRTWDDLEPGCAELDEVAAPRG